MVRHGFWQVHAGDARSMTLAPGLRYGRDLARLPPEVTMARLDPLPDAALGDLEPLLGLVERSMGFRPNSMATMARVPGLAPAFAQLAGVVWNATAADPGLKALVAVMASQASGCRYCQAHTAHRAHEQFAIPDDKLAALWSFEGSEVFDDAERAALRVAARAAQAPGAVTDADLEAMKEHFEDDAIAELVAMISLFGFLNRWNDTLGTDLETTPRGFAEAHLGATDWAPGAHGSGS
jgi:alkylhydroperoxidase family enzyme